MAPPEPSSLINYGVIPDKMSRFAKMFQFNKFLKSHKNGEFYNLTDSAIEYISKNFDPDLIYEGVKIHQKIWDTTYKKAMEPMREYLKLHTKEMLDDYNGKLINEQFEKYALGSISKWEMDSISCYYHEHELAKTKGKYHFENFYELPEEPQI